MSPFPSLSPPPTDSPLFFDANYRATTHHHHNKPTAPRRQANKAITLNSKHNLSMSSLSSRKEAVVVVLVEPVARVVRVFLLGES